MFPVSKGFYLNPIVLVFPQGIWKRFFEPKLNIMKKPELLNFLLGRIEELIPAGEGYTYRIDHNPVYGGYRLEKVTSQGVPHVCFGESTAGARLKFDPFEMKLRTIIGVAEEFANTRLRSERQTQALDDLQSVINSCHEGQSGEWDCSTDEGKEGFSDMADLLERVKSFVKTHN